MNIEGYFEAQKKNLANALQFEPFTALLPRIHQLYNFSIQFLPADMPPVFGQFLLVCHKSFLAAASLIGQAQPDDAAPITRRAIEVIRLAAAIKENPSKYQEWLAFEERSKRWQAREEGKKPKAVHVTFDVQHPTVLELVNTWGILSDYAVHFTPEYFASLGWIKGSNSLFLNYFTADQRTIERDIVLLAGTHCKILQVLDWCLDGAFSRSSEWACLMREAYEIGRPHGDKVGHSQQSEGR